MVGLGVRSGLSYEPGSTSIGVLSLNEEDGVNNDLGSTATSISAEETLEPRASLSKVLLTSPLLKFEVFIGIG